jgi:hypothetical protein
MAKQFWCWAAGVVLAGGSVYWSAYHACCKHYTAGETPRPNQPACGETTRCPCRARPAEFPGQPGASAAEQVSGPVTCAEHAPDYTPPPIVIREDEPPVAEPSELGGAAAWPVDAATGVARMPHADGAVPQEQVPDPAPLAAPTMPYCTDNATAVPHMPPADEDETRATPAYAWSEFLKACGASTGASVVPQPARERTDCQEDVHYHDHYSGCPYTGPGEAVPPAAGKKPWHAPGGDDCCPSPLRRNARPRTGKPGPKQGAEDCPRHPEVDTMEYRPSDGGLNEYGTVPH